MDKVDLVVKSGNVVRSDGVFPANIAIRAGKIVGITDDSMVPASNSVIDARGKVVLAGLLDTHAHMREPGTPDREDFTTGTQAAAATGVTTILEMPVSIPPTSSVEAFEAKRKLASAKAVVDFALYGGAGISSLAEIGPQAEAGAVAYKTFLHGPQAGREAEWEGIHITDDGELWEVFSEVAKTGLVHCVHAENHALIKHRIAQLRTEGRSDPMAHGESRPVVAEVEAVSRAIMFAKETGVRLNLVHISTGDAVALVNDAKKQGYSITVETCPHYLFQTEDAMRDLGPYAKINPPLRSREEQHRLWKYLREGVIDMIGTDHGPHRRSDKEKGWNDIFEAPSGVPALETSLPLLLNAVNEDQLDLQTLTAVTAERPAKIFGLYPQKGVIQVGSDADLVICDMQRETVLDSSRFYTKQKDGARLYDGWRTTGVPIMTLLRGEVVMQDGVVVGEPGYGRFVRPARR